MPRFSEKSMEQLQSSDYELMKLFTKIVEEYDCTVLQGHRGESEQNEYFRTGKSKVEWPNSRHNAFPSRAVDVAPYPIQWKNENRFYHFAGYVKGVAEGMGIKIRWGGDWDGDNDLDDQTFMDLVHFELK